MDKNVLLALIVWAIARDFMNLPMTFVLKHFMYDVKMSKRTAEQYADIVIADAMTDIRMGISYGVYDDKILNYKR